MSSKPELMGSGKVSLRGVCFREWLAMRKRKSGQQLNSIDDVNDNKPIILPNIAITNSKHKV